MMKVFAYITFENERSPRHAARNTPAKKICHLEGGFLEICQDTEDNVCVIMISVVIYLCDVAVRASVLQAG